MQCDKGILRPLWKSTTTIVVVDDFLRSCHRHLHLRHFRGIRSVVLGNRNVAEGLVEYHLPRHGGEYVLGVLPELFGGLNGRNLRPYHNRICHDRKRIKW
jgi:hypothetical protein